ncbi:MAG: hypothetical protein ACYDC5_13855 [Candidatus Dormibacteria bacterium]
MIEIILAAAATLFAYLSASRARESNRLTADAAKELGQTVTSLTDLRTILQRDAEVASAERSVGEAERALDALQAVADVATTALLPGTKQVNEMRQHSYSLARQHRENRLLMLDPTRQAEPFQNWWSMLGGNAALNIQLARGELAKEIQERLLALRKCLDGRAP